MNMAAAPKYGQLVFLGQESGRTYNVDAYFSDVANAPANWDNGSGATSTSLVYYKCPEKMTLIDLSVATGLTDTTNWVLTSDGAIIPGTTIRHANYLNSLNNRPKMSITFMRGSNLGIIQRA